MKTQRTLAAITIINLVLLAYQAVELGTADAQIEVSVLRGTGIEIVDDHGRLRAQLTIAPANESVKMPNGTSYPETVIFRLMTADGKPRVKITTSADGSGLLLLGDIDTTHTILKAEGRETSLKPRNNEETEQIVKP